MKHLLLLLPLTLVFTNTNVFSVDDVDVGDHVVIEAADPAYNPVLAERIAHVEIVQLGSTIDIEIPGEEVDGDEGDAPVQTVTIETGLAFADGITRMQALGAMLTGRGKAGYTALVHTGAEVVKSIDNGATAEKHWRGVRFQNSAAFTPQMWSAIQATIIGRVDHVVAIMIDADFNDAALESDLDKVVWRLIEEGYSGMDAQDIENRLGPRIVEGVEEDEEEDEEAGADSDVPDEEEDEEEEELLG